jgi:uncharacterized protein YggU (UPF0235/DUF167 family)
LIKYLSKLLNVPQSSVEVISGVYSRHKVIQVRGVSSEQCLKAFSLPQ